MKNKSQRKGAKRAKRKNKLASKKVAEQFSKISRIRDRADFRHSFKARVTQANIKHNTEVRAKLLEVLGMDKDDPTPTQTLVDAVNLKLKQEAESEPKAE